MSYINSNSRQSEQIREPVRIQFDGFGGTGKLSVLKHLKTAEIQTLVKQGKVQFAVFDIDPDQEDIFGENFYWLGDKVLTHDLFEKFRSNSEQFPGCEHLGDVDLLQKAAGKSNQLINGAQTAPTLGLHALLCHLWWRWPKLRNFLIRPIKNLTAISRPVQQESLVTGGRRPPQIVIVAAASSGGGTGSGIFMDLADLRHDVQKKEGIQHYEIYLDLFLPGAFSSEHQERIQANTWARFLQLSDRYLEHKQLPRILGPVTLPRKQPPLAGITVWDTTTTEGETYSGREPLIEVQVGVNRMKYLGPMGATYLSRLVDLSEHDDNNFLSAAGCFSYVIEVVALIKKGATELSQRVISHYLLRALPETTARQNADQQIQDFIHQTKLTKLSRRFAYDTAGRQLLVHLDPIAFQQVKRQDLPQALANWRQDFFALATKELAQLTVRERRRLTTNLVKFCQALLNSPDGGVIQLGFFLDALLDWLQAQIQQQRWQRDNQAENLADHVREMQDQRFLYRLWRATWSKEGYLKKRPEKEFGMELRLEQLEAELKVWMAMEENTQRLQKAQQHWMAVFKHLLNQLKQHQEQLASQREAERPVCEKNIPFAEEEAELIEEQVQTATIPAQQGLSFAWQKEDGAFHLLCNAGTSDQMTLGRSDFLWTEAGMDRYLSYFHHFFAPFEKLSIEQLFAKQPEAVEQLLMEMERRAAPCIVLDSLKQQPEPKKLIVFGAEKGDKGYFAAVSQRKNWITVETDDPHRVDLLTTWHHISPAAIAQAEEWQAAYERQLGHVALHTDVAWHQDHPSEANAKSKQSEMMSNINGRKPGEGHQNSGKESVKNVAKT